MKKRANNSRKIIKDNSFFYAYLVLIPSVIFLNVFAYYIRPQESGKPFFEVSKNLQQRPSKKTDWKKELTYSKRMSNHQNEIVFHGDRNKKQIALTFDADMTDGMAKRIKSGQVHSYYDRRLIEELRKLKTPATLFLSGKWVEMYPNETKDLATDPLFELGSHSYAHRSYTPSCYGLLPLEDAEKIQDIGTSQYLIQQYTGTRTKLFRFPGGCYSHKDLLLVKKAGMTTVQWDTVADDGFNPYSDAILSSIIRRAKNGSIIVMHMNGFPNEPFNYMVVPKAVSILREKGFEFVKVSKLLENYDKIE